MTSSLSTMPTQQHTPPSRRWVPYVGGLLCATWAFIAWIAVIPNQDILADNIQAQSLLLDPRIVLAFPGQKHGGPLEYPATVLAEWLLPGNFYASSAVRIALAFLTGFLAAKLALRLYPKTRAWALLIAMGVGPTIIQGLQLPGVWWMQPNYDMAWLLITAGSLTLAWAAQTSAAAASATRGALRAVAAGLLLGLGIYAHPVIVLMAIPMITLVILVARVRLRVAALAAFGLALGLIPAMLSYVINDEVNVWDPSHKPFIYPAWLWEMGSTALGINGIADPSRALMPYAMGLSPTQSPFSGPAQSAIVTSVLLACLIVSVVGVFNAVRARRWISPATALAASWLAAAATMVVFITSVDPVWHYSAGLSVLAWISIGALPSLVPVRHLGAGLAIVAIGLLATSTWAQNASYLTSLPERAATKARYMEDLARTAEALHSHGARVIFGSYVDAIPVGYASNWALRTVTNKYDRFPLTGDEVNQASYVVAVREDGDPAALEAVRAACRPIEVGLALPSGNFTIATCPTSVLIGS